MVGEKRRCGPVEFRTLKYFLTVAREENITRAAGLLHVTQPTLSRQLQQLEEELRKVRSQGWAMDHEEYEIGNRCIAAPIYDYCGEIVAAISASGSTIQIPDEKIPEIAEGVMQIAHEISRGLGYTG